MNSAEMPVELVVFDWDGTLMDSTQAIAESIQLSARDLGLPVPSDTAASHVIGLGLKDALQLAVPSLPAELMPAFLERYRVHYFERDQHLAPFEGAQAFLAELLALGVPAAVATGKSRVGLDRALRTAGWERYFQTSRCADEGRPKPDPWMLLEVCRQIGVAPSRTLMIGDTTHDLLMAESAGARSIAVTYGAHPKETLASAQPMALCHSIAQLRAVVLPLVSDSRSRTAFERPGSSSALEEWQRVCASDQLIEGGDGVRFKWRNAAAASLDAFVIRFEGQPRAYINQCRHVPVEMDWPQGKFFDESGRYIVCATHGALYSAQDGHCQGGPCGARGLRKLDSRDHDGGVWIRQSA